MKYEWDLMKAAANRRKHLVDFEDAIDAVEDPQRLEEVDDRHDYGEERARIIGMAASDVLFVVTTMRGPETCRIISARKATRHEQTRYYAGDREPW